MTRRPLPGTALDALLGQPFDSVAWPDALERLEGPHPLGETPDVQAVLALPVMARLAPAFERRQLKLVVEPVIDAGEAALYLTLGQARGVRYLVGSTERAVTGVALRVYGQPLSQALSVADPLTPVAALFAPAPLPIRVSTRAVVSVDHPGGVLQAAYEQVRQDHPHVLGTGLHFEVASHQGRTLTLDVTAEVGHGPEGLEWAEPDRAPPPASPGFP